MEEEEQKVQSETKLTLGQINNPQSACGNVSGNASSFFFAMG
jgi:hypothetical protein